MGPSVGGRLIARPMSIGTASSIQFGAPEHGPTKTNEGHEGQSMNEGQVIQSTLDQCALDRCFRARWLMGDNVSDAADR